MSNLSEADNEVKKSSGDQKISDCNDNTSPDRRRCFILQNFILIWFDPNDDYHHSLTQLQQIVTTIDIFTDGAECVKYLTDTKNEKVFMIVSDTLGQQFVPCIHDIPQLHSIYVLTSDVITDKTWMMKWNKVVGVYTDIQSICDSLTKRTRQCDQDLAPFSIISPSDYSKEDLNELPSLFMYSQILKEILFDMEENEDAKKQLVEFWRNHYLNNNLQMPIIDDFEKSYDPNSSIWWYSHQRFLYSQLNRALRIMDIDILIHMGFFLRDLHQEIKQLHEKQSTTRDPFIVYQGQGILNSEFEQLRKSKGGLLSFNNFLSTSIDKKVSLLFCPNPPPDPNIIPILFEMQIEPALISTPFARIDHLSKFPEEKEILFSMHSVFRIGEIEQNNHSIWQVKLKLTTQDDQEFRRLTEHIRNETSGSTGWHRLGQLMIRMGNFEKAEEFYKTLIEKKSDNSEKTHSHLYHQLGLIQIDQGHFEDALHLYQENKTMSSASGCSEVHNDPLYYSNMGMVYYNMRDYPKALESYRKSLEIQEKKNPSNYLSLATTCSNIALVCHHVNNWSEEGIFFDKAIDFYTIAMDTGRRHHDLLLYHPELPKDLFNVAFLHENQEEYLKVLNFYEYSLTVKYKSSHSYSSMPNLSSIFIELGSLYKNKGMYNRALRYHQEALTSLQRSLSSTHPTIALVYNNMGSVQQKAGNYSEAYEFYRKSLGIQYRSLPPNHLDIATTYGNIASMYDELGQRSETYQLHQKLLQIQYEYPPTDNILMPVLHTPIGLILQRIPHYHIALMFYKKNTGNSTNVPSSTSSPFSCNL